MAIQENNIAYVNCLNGDTGKVELEKRIEVIKLSIDNPAVIMKDAQKFAVCLSNVISGTMADWVFNLNNQVLAIKVFASTSALKNYTLAANEIAYVGGDPYLRNVVWLHIKNLDKTLSCEYLTEASVCNSFNMNEIAKKINKLNPSQIDDDITDLKERIDTAERRLEVLDIQIDQIGNDIEGLKTKTDTTNNNLNNLSSRVSTVETDVSTLKTKASTVESDITAMKNRTAGLSRTDTTTTITDSLKATGTLEVIGKSTMKDIEVKGNIAVAGDSSVKKLTATEINTPVVKNGDYKALFYREGIIADTLRLKKMTVEVNVSGANKKIILKGSYEETKSETLNNNAYYSKDVDLPFMFDKITGSTFKTSTEGIFMVSSDTSDVATNKITIGYRNVSGSTENIQYKIRQFVVEGICNNIDSIVGITWIN